MARISIRSFLTASCIFLLAFSIVFKTNPDANDIIIKGKGWFAVGTPSNNFMTFVEVLNVASIFADTHDKITIPQFLTTGAYCAADPKIFVPTTNIPEREEIEGKKNGCKKPTEFSVISKVII